MPEPQTRNDAWRHDLRLFLAERVGQALNVGNLYARFGECIPLHHATRIWLADHEELGVTPHDVMRRRAFSKVLRSLAVEFDPPLSRLRPLRDDAMVKALAKGSKPINGRKRLEHEHAGGGAVIFPEERTAPRPPVIAAEQHRPYWSVARTIAHLEATVERRLAAAGFETFSPQTPRGPLFKNYLFIRIEAQWRAASTTVGVLCLIRFGLEPARCPDLEVERLRAMVGSDGYIHLPDNPALGPRRVFKYGDKVKFIGGPFEGVRAIHSGMRAGDRERVLLSLLGSKARPVMAPSHQLAHAS